MENIKQELFAPPFGLKTIIKIDNETLFTSDKLKHKFLLSMSKTGRAKMINNYLESLVQKEYVNPVFMNKSILKMLAFKIFASRENKMTAGFYHIKLKKVYILIDNHMNAFGFSGNDLLASTLIHECIHMAAGRQPAKFFSIFKSEFEDFYGSIFDSVFKLDSPKPKKEIADITKFIFDNFEKKSNKMSDFNKQLINYHKKLQVLEKYSTLDKQEFLRILQDYIVCIKLYLMSTRVFLQKMRNYKHIISPIYQAYKDTYNESNMITLCIQELFVPSEIACVSSEIKPSSRHKQAYKFMS